MAAATETLPRWTWICPLASVAAIAVALLTGLPDAVAILAGLTLVPTVIAAVHHAEVVAHRVGEPYGTLVLAIAVTIIEVALIVSVMVGAPEAKAGLARDTVFSAVMIACNGIVGGSLLLGGVRYREQDFKLDGASAALAVLAALTTLTMIVPNFTIAAPGPSFSPAQLAFAGIASLILYGSFVFVQTVRHRDYFLAAGDDEDHPVAPPPSDQAALTSLALLVLSLVAVVVLAKLLTPSLEKAIYAMGAPKALVALVIAALVLFPEALAGLKAARENRLQTSLNLALGSALASIGLTIPAVAAVALAFKMPLEARPQRHGGSAAGAHASLLGIITLGTGRTIDPARHRAPDGLRRLHLLRAGAVSEFERLPPPTCSRAASLRGRYEVGERQRSLALQRQCSRHRRGQRRAPRGRAARREPVISSASSGATANDVAALVLAEPERHAAACGPHRGHASMPTPRAAGQRHLGDRDQQPAVGAVVHGGDACLRGSARARNRRPALGREIDRRRRAFQRPRASRR